MTFVWSKVNQISFKLLVVKKCVCIHVLYVCICEHICHMHACTCVMCVHVCYIGVYIWVIGMYMWYACAWVLYVHVPVCCVCTGLLHVCVCVCMHVENKVDFRYFRFHSLLFSESESLPRDHWLVRLAGLQTLMTCWSHNPRTRVRYVSSDMQDLNLGRLDCPRATSLTEPSVQGWGRFLICSCSCQG